MVVKKMKKIDTLMRFELATLRLSDAALNASRV